MNVPDSVYAPGDVGLAHGSGLVDGAIRFAETLRYGRGSAEARWNHAFMIVSSSGDLIQAEGQGVVPGTMASDYGHGDYVVLRPSYPSWGAERAKAAMTALLNDHYGYLEIVSEALSFLVQTKLRFAIEGQQICSGAVSFALDQGGIFMGYDEQWNSPADVMHYALDNKWQWVEGTPISEIEGALSTRKRRRGRQAPSSP
jgi:hypothetical protein